MKTLAGHEGRPGSWEAMRREYAVLLLRVERELLRYLDEHADGDAGESANNERGGLS